MDVHHPPGEIRGYHQPLEEAGEHDQVGGCPPAMVEDRVTELLLSGPARRKRFSLDHGGGNLRLFGKLQPSHRRAARYDQQ